MKLTALLAALALACVFVGPAEARPKHHIPDAGQMVGCSDPVQKPCYFGDVETRSAPPKTTKKANKYRHSLVTSADLSTTPRGAIIGSRPAGCPRAHCGCGASLYLFGKIIPSLNLAASWLRFPRALPAPGMAAARRGHVMVLKRHIGGKAVEAAKPSCIPDPLRGFRLLIRVRRGWRCNDGP